tara:strand:+ start:845 stop:1189 length:345 start_codon:yes stop_codon:yes gene_type:complete
MTKVIHSDFLTVAEAMTSAFSTIEKNEDWDLMPSLVQELTLCLYMPRGNKIYIASSWNMKKATKQEMEFRSGFSADLLAQVHSCTEVTIRVTDEYNLSQSKLEELLLRQWSSRL